MPSAWEQYQQDAHNVEEAAKAEERKIVEEVEKFYHDLTDKAQSAALEARGEDVGHGESEEAFQARINAAPGIFNDRNQGAVEVTQTENIQAQAEKDALAPADNGEENDDSETEEPTVEDSNEQQTEPEGQEDTSEPEATEGAENA